MEVPESQQALQMFTGTRQHTLKVLRDELRLLHPQIIIHIQLVILRRQESNIGDQALHNVTSGSVRIAPEVDSAMSVSRWHSSLLSVLHYKQPLHALSSGLCQAM